MSGLTPYAVNKLIDFMFRGQPFTPPSTYFFALMRDDSEGGNEVSGAGYSRVGLAANMSNFSGTQAAGSTTVSSGTSGSTSNNVAIQYGTPTANWGLIAKVWVYDAETGGNCIAKGLLDVAKNVSAGDAPPLFTVSSLDLS